VLHATTGHDPAKRLARSAVAIDRLSERAIQADAVRARQTSFPQVTEAEAAELRRLLLPLYDATILTD
jgi:hypothetical protein